MKIVEEERTTIRGRAVKYEIKGGFHKWKWKYKATVWDIETGLTGEAGGTSARDTALNRAINDLWNKLSTSGHLTATKLSSSESQTETLSTSISTPVLSISIPAVPSSSTPVLSLTTPVPSIDTPVSFYEETKTTDIFGSSIIMFGVSIVLVLISIYYLKQKKKIRPNYRDSSKRPTLQGSGNTLTNCNVSRTALAQCTDRIVRSNIDPFALARILFSKEIISEIVYRNVRDRTSGCTNEERLETILDDLRSRIEHDADILMSLVNILRDDFNRNDLVDEIMSKLDTST